MKKKFVWKNTEKETWTLDLSSTHVHLSLCLRKTRDKTFPYEVYIASYGLKNKNGGFTFSLRQMMRESELKDAQTKAVCYLQDLAVNWESKTQNYLEGARHEPHLSLF